MLTPDTLKAAFAAALPYDRYLATGSPGQQQDWRAFERRAREEASLTTDQRSLLSDFSRHINVLVISGLWCGDCAQQCPLLHMIAERAERLIDLRFVDRDQHKDLAEAVRICGGLRVPTVLFLNEDFEFVALAGDKSLSRLRAQAKKALGATCPLPGAPVPADEIAATLADWLADFERVHLLLRLSAKLRQRHND
jgi:thiol-disulfide isomerase/thioredoxin